MCGILGGINTQFDQGSVALLRHRGPDQASHVVEEVAGHGTVVLGQTRLNVVDRNDVDLPIRVGGSVILFNGEIYNHIELRSELETLGWSFNTRTDTEVALTAYLQWGAECLNRFNGMFAMVVWDGERFFCARDRVGKKPLYYRCGRGSFEFTSEIKTLANLEFESQDIFDLFEFCFNEHTIYRDVFSIPPGSYLVYDLQRGTCHTHAYWDIEHQIANKITDERTAVNGFIELLEDSVRLRLRSDVPVTVLLSGGLDSALIATLANVDEAFTCQFDELRDTINEELFARDLTRRLGTTVNMVRPTRAEFLENLSTMAYHLEMPTGSFSAFPLYRLAAACRQRGFKVTLSGEGADELFAGYARSEFLLADRCRTDDPKREHYAWMLGRYHGSGLDRFCRMASRSGLNGASLMKMFLANLWDDRKSMLENICYVETRIFLQPLLQMADRMCMAHGVEQRCPFLDHRIVEFAFSLDDSLRYRDGVGKWIVHQAARKLLPRGSLVLERSVKDGLATPVNLWMLGKHGFDRRHWKALMTAECINSLLVRRNRILAEYIRPSADVLSDGIRLGHRPAAHATDAVT